MRLPFPTLLLSSLIALAGCSHDSGTSSSTSSVTNTPLALVAPNGPGELPTWSYAGKTGIGTSFEQYQSGQYQDQGNTGTVSKVWFSIAQGIITETMYGLIHEAQLKEMQFFIQGTDFLDEERVDTISHTEYLHTDNEGRPLSLAYKIVNKDREGRYQIEKHIFTDPAQQSLMVKVIFTAHEPGITAYLAVNPHIKNTGTGDRAWQQDNAWFAAEGDRAMAIKTNANITKSVVGFMGTSDGITQLKNDKQLKNLYNTTEDQTGNVRITLQMPSVESGSAEWLISLGFGESAKAAEQAADATLARGYQTVLDHYNGKGDAIGWEDYLASLPALNSLANTATDGGKLLYASALVLKAQEDKTHAGALIASLSNPWGEIVPATDSRTGYKAVWPRDFYQVAMAMLALGDKETPKVAFEYLKKVQVTHKTPGFSGTPGWFLQKTQVDGQLEWIAIQMDQTAMPIMLGYRLWKEGVLSDQDAIFWYHEMLKPAADFLATGGTIKFDWIDLTLVPPFTQQERWEEQGGYSPSSTAAIVAGLVTGAELAKLAGDQVSAEKYLAAADKISTEIESSMFTTEGSLTDDLGNGKYYLRITENKNPNDLAPLETRNGVVINNESEVIDGGFLELVRYGVRKADDQYIRETLPEVDNQNLPDKLRLKYEFSYPGVEGTFPGWRRYGIDGYGEDTKTGLAYGAIDYIMSEDQRGRVWPFFTGERGHYELAYAKITGTLDSTKTESLRKTYVKGLELFANEGLMLPEQVFDGVGNNEHYQYPLGGGTNSATPLAWTHAEYIKLLRSISDQAVWDNYAPVTERFSQ